jgi:aminopeptidase N
MGVTLLADWFPMLAVYDGKSWHLDEILAWGDPVYSEISFFEVWFSAPQGYVPVSTGVRVSSENEGGQATHHFRSGPAREFVLVLGVNWQVEPATVGDTLVRSYFFPEDRLSGEEALAASADALQAFNRRFGLYPYSEFEIVEAPILGILGMEYPGVVLLADRMYTGDQKWRLDITAAHEVAHQWWYGVVGNDVFAEPWLDEALATFSSGVYVEDVWGVASFEVQYQEWVARYESGLAQGNAGHIAWPLREFEGSGPYVSTVYYKGAVFLNALREEIGDDAFFAALRQYYEEFQFRQAESSDFLAALEKTSGRELDALYQQWLYGE